MNRLANIQHDKLLHFFYGTLISFIGIGLCGLSGLWLTVVAGAWKELVYDWWLGRGKPDLMDFLWTILPALMFILLELWQS
tara:strand:- start:664 stop:906 length:243 start_codon:yes stop_codon:yes gene_type:complete